METIIDILNSLSHIDNVYIASGCILLAGCIRYWEKKKLKKAGKLTE